MKRAALVLFLLSVPLALLAGCQSQQSVGGLQTGEPQGLLANLEGHWTGNVWGGRFDVVYSGNTSGQVLSFARLFQGEKATFYEFEVFKFGEGRWRMQPFPNGKPEAIFELVSDEGQADFLVFQNPDNDFPTRVTYDTRNQGKLIIELTDPERDPGKIERFDLTRIP